MRAQFPTRLVQTAVAADLRALVVTIVLLAGFFRGWSQSSLGAPVTVFHLRLDVPTLPVLNHISWGWLLLLAWLFALAGSVTADPRRRARALTCAGVLALTSAIGFVVLTASAGGVRLAQLAADRTQLTVLTKTMGYTVLRPDITVLGPFALPHSAGLVLSSLRSGIYLTLICAALLLWRARVATRHANAMNLLARGEGSKRHAVALNNRFRVSALAYLPALIVGWGLIAAGFASMQVSRAVDSADSGNYKAAMGHVRSASWWNSASLAEPDNADKVGTIKLAAGQKSSAESQLALSRQEVTAGHTLDALRILAAATDAAPKNEALRAELVTQSVSYINAHNDPWLVRTVVPSRASSPLLKLVLAKYELDGGDNPTVLLDSRAAERDSADSDLKSAAMTLQSLALSRSGDVIGGRRALVDAIDQDHDFVNVMARSLAAGLYTTVQP